MKEEIKILKENEKKFNLNIKTFKFYFGKRNIYLEIFKRIDDENLQSIISEFETACNKSFLDFKSNIFSSIKQMFDLFEKKDFSLKSIEEDRKIIKSGYECLKELQQIKENN